MNPHASTKCAGRLLMALAAITSIFLTVGCSSSSLPTPNKEGFGDGNLSGTYVISISGTDVNTTNDNIVPFAIVGTIAANGSGGITGGTVDINDPGNLGVHTGQAVSSSSSYRVGQDGRGTGTLVTPVGSFNIDFVLTSDNHGLITRFDSSGSGSGTLDTQGTASQSSLASLAFSLSGADSSGYTLGTVGGFTLNTSSGTITSGIQDFNDYGSSAESGLTGLPLNGSVVLASSGTSGTAQLDTSFGSFGFDVWVIDSTHLKFIENDTARTGVVLAGDAFTQQTSFTAGQVVFTLGGLDTSKNPFVAGGYATAAANGTLSSGLEDYNDNGIPNTVPSFTGTCTTFVAGRCQLALNAFTNVTATNLEFAAYPSSGGVLVLEDDNYGLAQGAAYAQSATSFAAQGYGLNLSGVNTGPDGEVDDIAQFNAGSPDTSSTGPQNMAGILDENDLAYQLNFDRSLGGIYIPDPTADGRGSISVSIPETLIGGLTLEYYVVDGSTVLFIEGDNNQVAAGTFQSQSASGAGGDARSRIAIVHPAVGAHGALRGK